MNTKILALLLVFMPCIADAAARSSNPRVGVNRVTAAGQRMPTMTTNISGGNMSVSVTPPAEDEGNAGTGTGGVVQNKNCREAYSACMDDFCLFDESDGYRCACSDKINASKSLIQEIQDLQAKADKIYTEEVERAKLGAKADAIFKEIEINKQPKPRTLRDILLGNGSDDIAEEDDEADLTTDEQFGDALYDSAHELCKVELSGCSTNEIEKAKALYSRQITADCKAFASYLDDQKINAEANVRTAEAAVRQARLSVFDMTNKYNRGECLLAYRACIADKGGCGVNFENCLDADLLNRRASACENILDQCMHVRKDVEQDWGAESTYILKEAEKYAEKYFLQTCLAKTQLCLEDACSISTNSACLENIEVAKGLCPIINECEQGMELTENKKTTAIAGFSGVIASKLKYLRIRFCQNDIEACFKEKCGENFAGPECLGKSLETIKGMCPKIMFPVCNAIGDSEASFDTIISSVVLQLDYQMLQGCINYFDEQLGRACGTDMSCLPSSALVAGIQDIEDGVVTYFSESDTGSVSINGKILDNKQIERADIAGFRSKVQEEAEDAVNKFMEKLKGDHYVAACSSAVKPDGEDNLEVSVYKTAMLIAKTSAVNRALREFESKITELAREKDVEAARQLCLDTYKVEKPEKGKKNYSYIRSVSFEPDLRNCHVCRMQQVCETGGQSEWAGAAQGVAGGLSSGAAMGTMVNAGWGTVIGGAVGALGGGALGYFASGEEEYCQEIESCEDINM